MLQNSTSVATNATQFEKLCYNNGDPVLTNAGRSRPTVSSTAVISEIWHQFSVLWKDRNEVIHGRDNATRNQAERRVIELKIKKVYSNRDKLLPEDQDLLMDSVDRHLEVSTTRLVNWYNTFEPVFCASFAESKRRATSRTLPITTYFRRAVSAVRDRVAGRPKTPVDSDETENT